MNMLFLFLNQFCDFSAFSLLVVFEVGVYRQSLCVLNHHVGFQKLMSVIQSNRNVIFVGWLWDALSHIRFLLLIVDKHFTLWCFTKSRINSLFLNGLLWNGGVSNCINALVMFSIKQVRGSINFWDHFISAHVIGDLSCPTISLFGRLPLFQIFKDIHFIKDRSWLADSQIGVATIVRLVVSVLSMRWPKTSFRPCTFLISIVQNIVNSCARLIQAWCKLSLFIHFQNLI